MCLSLLAQLVAALTSITHETFFCHNSKLFCAQYNFCNWQLGPEAYERHASGGDPAGQGFPQGNPFGDIFTDVRVIVLGILFYVSLICPRLIYTLIVLHLSFGEIIHETYDSQLKYAIFLFDCFASCNCEKHEWKRNCMQVAMKNHVTRF